MAHRIIPAIMSGGAGVRLWPLSTEARPKQFHTLGWDQTLFAATLARVTGARGELAFAAPIVLCNARHEALVRESLGGAPATLVLESAPRNTAAIGAIAAAVAAERDLDARVLLLPSDHIVANVAAFHDTLARAMPITADHIVTLGITPTRPAISYGYITRGESIGEGLFAIKRFKEKPNAATARDYIAAGDSYWNAGIFLFRPEILLAEFGANADIRDAGLASLSRARRSGDKIELDAEAFARTRAAPLDIAVMENTAQAAVAPCDIGWADVGTWDEVWRLAPRDPEGFRVLGPSVEADALKMEACGVKTVVVDGEDLVVVAAPRGLMIVPRATAADAAALRGLSEKF